MLDIMLINPAAYGGTARRGPYELGGFVETLQQARFKATLVDLQEAVGRQQLRYPDGYVDEAIAMLECYPSRMYVITIRTTGGPWALELAKLIKQRTPTAPILAYAPRIEERLLRNMRGGESPFDAVCLSGPSFDIVRLVELCLQQGIAGLPASKDAVTKDGVLSRVSSAPADELFETGSPWISNDRSIAAILIGRGCPERCTFCAAPLGAGGRPRYAPAHEIVRAAQQAYDALDPERRLFVMLETENFTSERQLVHAMSRERARSGSDFKWGAYGRIDHIDEEFARFLADSGCRFLFFGVETAVPHLLRLLGKHYDPDLVLPAIRNLQRLGIVTQSSLIFGIPNETWSDFLATASLAADITWAGGYVDWTPLRIEAGSPMETLTRGASTRLLRHSPLYKELQAAGIAPESCDPSLGYRLYALEMSDFDIDMACRAATRYRTALVHYPLGVYVLCRGLGRQIQDVVSAFLSGEDDRTDTTVAHTLLQLADGVDDAARGFLVDMLLVEEWMMNGGSVGGASPKTYNLIPVYRMFRERPELIPVVLQLPWWHDQAHRELARQL